MLSFQERVLQTEKEKVAINIIIICITPFNRRKRKSGMPRGLNYINTKEQEKKNTFSITANAKKKLQFNQSNVTITTLQSLRKTQTQQHLSNVFNPAHGHADN